VIQFGSSAVTASLGIRLDGENLPSIINPQDIISQQDSAFAVRSVRFEKHFFSTPVPTAWRCSACLLGSAHTQIVQISFGQLPNSPSTNSARPSDNTISSAPSLRIFFSLQGWLLASIALAQARGKAVFLLCILAFVCHFPFAMAPQPLVVTLTATIPTNFPLREVAVDIADGTFSMTGRSELSSLNVSLCRGSFLMP
jgi:hypothetical protein